MQKEAHLLLEGEGTTSKKEDAFIEIPREVNQHLLQQEQPYSTAHTQQETSSTIPKTNSQQRETVQLYGRTAWARFPRQTYSVLRQHLLQLVW